MRSHYNYVSDSADSGNEYRNGSDADAYEPHTKSDKKRKSKHQKYYSTKIITNSDDDYQVRKDSSQEGALPYAKVHISDSFKYFFGKPVRGTETGDDRMSSRQFHNRHIHKNIVNDDEFPELGNRGYRTPKKENTGYGNSSGGKRSASYTPEAILQTRKAELNRTQSTYRDQSTRRSKSRSDDTRQRSNSRRRERKDTETTSESESEGEPTPRSRSNTRRTQSSHQHAVESESEISEIETMPSAMDGRTTIIQDTTYLPTFDSADFADFKAHCSQFSNQAQVLYGSDTRLWVPKFVSTIVGGPVSQVIQPMLHTNMYFADLRNRLYDYFRLILEPEARTTAKKTYNNLRMKNTETIEQFAIRHETAFRQAYPKVDPNYSSRILDNFISRLIRSAQHVVRNSLANARIANQHPQWCNVKTGLKAMQRTWEASGEYKRANINVESLSKKTARLQLENEQGGPMLKTPTSPPTSPPNGAMELYQKSRATKWSN